MPTDVDDTTDLWRFRCPDCVAAPGQPCRYQTDPGKGEPMRLVHGGREIRNRQHTAYLATLRDEDPKAISPLEVACPVCQAKVIQQCRIILDDVARYTVPWFHQDRVHRAETSAITTGLFPLAA